MVVGVAVEGLCSEAESLLLAAIEAEVGTVLERVASILSYEVIFI